MLIHNITPNYTELRHIILLLYTYTLYMLQPATTAAFHLGIHILLLCNTIQNININT